MSTDCPQLYNGYSEIVRESTTFNKSRLDILNLLSTKEKPSELFSEGFFIELLVLTSIQIRDH